VTVTSHDLLAAARKFEGQKYVFGAEIDTQGRGYIGPVDCSELVQHACLRVGVKPGMPDGAYWQWIHTRHLAIPIDVARRTHGALMFMGDGTGTGREAIFHVAFSLGDGRTFEARSSSYPVRVFEKRDGWTFAAKIPGVIHDVVPPTPPPPPPATFDPRLLNEHLIMAKAVYDLAGIIAYVDLTYARWHRTPAQDLKGRMYWIDLARTSEDPGAVLTQCVVTLQEREGDPESTPR